MYNKKFAKILNPSEVIQLVKSGHPQNGWVIYRHNLTWAIFGLLLRLFYFGIFAGGAAVFIIYTSSSQRAAASEENVYAGVFLIGALIASYYILKHLYFLSYHKKNMIVLTDNEIVKSWGGRIKKYPYKSISDLRIVRIQGRNRPYSRFPEHYIEFLDKNTNRIIRLAQNRTFGRADEIYTMLQTKL